MTAHGLSTPAAPRKPPGAPSRQPGVDGAVRALARAVQRVRAYPHGSPLASAALDAAHRALTGLNRDMLVLRVEQRTLLVDDVPVQTSPPVAELAGRLHQASIGTLTLARDASIRDVSVFCRELVHHEAGATLLPDSLRDRGIEKVSVTVFERPAVLEVGLPASGRVEQLHRQHARAEATGRTETAGYRYPAGKGWVRMDPGSAAPSRVSLTDLAQLVADPFALAQMLVALSDDPPPADSAEALSRTFEEIAALFGAVDPATAETLLAGLARALLALESDKRQQLLRDSLLPGLIEGRLDSGVLRHLPDLELADSLALLLDLQVAAPELLGLALDRLELSDERRERLEPFLKERLAAGKAEPDRAAGAIDGYADGRIRVDLSLEKEFRDFAGLDLALDAHAERALVETREAIATTDPRETRVGCLLHLVALEANPAPAAQRLQTLQSMLIEMRTAGAWPAVARWVERLGALQNALAADRPDISSEIASMLGQTVDEAWVVEAGRLAERDAGAPLAAYLVSAAGPAIVPALVKVLEGSRAPRQAVIRLMSAHAAPIVQSLGAHLNHAVPAVVRDLVGILGHAGPGVEGMIGSTLAHPDPQVVRQACRSLAQVATTHAIRVVAGQLSARGARGTLAEETFWRFPPQVAGAEARRLLGDAAFVSAHPGVARRLLVKAAERRMDGLGAVLGQLSALRAHVWRPSHMWVGFTAARIHARIR